MECALNKSKSLPPQPKQNREEEKCSFFVCVCLVVIFICLSFMCGVCLLIACLVVFSLR